MSQELSQGKKNPITIGEKAQEHLCTLLKKNNAKAMMIKLRSRGCSGLSYVMDYVADPEKHATDCEAFSIGEHHILLVQKKAMMFLFGTHLDYQQDPIKSGFVFENPNEKGRCGCGQSFHVS